jgi:hypothetical protein
MANTLTKQVMATIVARCEGYQPMKAATVNTAPIMGQVTAGNGVALNRREEALLSQIIHKKTTVETGTAQAHSHPVTVRERQMEASGEREQRTTLPNTIAFRKDGVVSLDALIQEMKK